MNGTLPLRRPLAAALVAGCAALAPAAFALDSDAPAAKSSAAVKKTPAKPRWIEAAAKHGGSGIRLRYSVADSVQPGVPADVRLQFSGVETDDASVELRPPHGASLTDAAGNAVRSVLLPRGSTTTLVLRLTPVADGAQTLDVFTSQGQRLSAQSVLLNVGSGKLDLQKMGKAQTTPSGEKVISLPAETR